MRIAQQTTDSMTREKRLAKLAKHAGMMSLMIAIHILVMNGKSLASHIHSFMTHSPFNACILLDMVFPTIRVEEAAKLHDHDALEIVCLLA